MARSLQQQLDDIDAAIAAIETGAQEYSIEGVTVKRGELSTLYKRRDSIATRLARSTNGPKVVRIVGRH